MNSAALIVASLRDVLALIGLVTLLRWTVKGSGAVRRLFDRVRARRSNPARVGTNPHQE